MSDVTPLPEPDERTRKRRENIGVSVTVAYLSGFAVYALVCLEAFLEMKPDEFATLLSGAFAPLAFLWLILGFKQQGDELRQSSRALWLQSEELRNSVEQQQQLVTVTREQLQFERDQLDADKREAQRRAQPDLVLLREGWSTTPRGEVLAQLQLLNRAPTCTDLHVWRDDAVRAAAPMLMTAKGLEFKVVVRPDEPLGEIAFRVTYLDSLQYRGEKIFKANVVQNNGGHRHLEVR